MAGVEGGLVDRYPRAQPPDRPAAEPPEVDAALEAALEAAPADARPRRSPPAERVVRLVEFLSAQPGRRFTLTEIYRGAGLSKGTALGIVNSLVDVQYLDCDRGTQTYALGPRLVAVGRAAAEGPAAVSAARPHMEEFSRRFGLPCLAERLVRDVVVIVERTGPGGVGLAAHVGHRHPFRPPWSIGFCAWRGDRALEEWLARDPQGSAEADRRAREVTAFARRHGHLAERYSESAVRAFRYLQSMPPDPAAGFYVERLEEALGTLVERDYITDLPAGDAVVGVSGIRVPVYGAQGEPTLLLIGSVNRERVTAAEYGRIARGLVAAGDAVTADLGGHDPWRGGQR